MSNDPGVSQLAEETDLKSVKCEFKSHLPDQLLCSIFKRVKLDGNCLIWLGAKSPNGYGKIKYDRRAYDIHRLVGRFLFGKLNTSDEICHEQKCTSKLCIRPSHLYKGNSKTNVRDAIKMGTWNNFGR